MSALRNLARDTVVYGLSTAVSSGIGFILVPLYTRSLSVADYGVLATYNTTLVFAGIFISFSLDNAAATWYVTHKDDEDRRRTFSSWLAFLVVAGGAAGAALVAFRAPLARLLLGSERLSPVLVAAGASVLTTSIPKVGALWYRMELRAKPSVALSLIAPVVTATTALALLALRRLDLTGIVVAQASGAALSTVVTLLVMRGRLSWARAQWSRLREMLAFSTPFVGTIILSWCMTSAVVYILTLLGSKEEVAHYQLASTLSSIVGLASFAFVQAWTPFAMSLPEEDRSAIYGSATELSASLGAALSVLATLTALPMLRLVTGKSSYDASEPVLAVLLLNQSVMTLPSVFAVIFAVKARSAPLLVASAVGAATTLPLLGLAHVLHGGILGAALAISMGGTAYTAWAFRDAHALIPMRLSRWRMVLAFVVAAGLDAGLLVSRGVWPGLVAQIVVRAAIGLVAVGLVVGAYLPTLRALAAERRRRAALPAGA